MIVHRLCRRLVAAGLAAALLLAVPAEAQDFPSRPIRVVIAFPAGGPTDFVGRLVADKVKDILGQTVIIENKPGANGAIGADSVAKAPADGYTLFLSTVGAVAITPNMRTDLPYDVLRDFAAVTLVVRNTTVLVVRADSPVKSVKEFVEMAKSKNGDLPFASTGVGSTTHLAEEMFSTVAGFKFVHVPYRGAAPAITDLLGGQVQVMFDVTVTALPQIKSGKLKALGVTTLERLPPLPDVPTIDSTIKGYEATAWIGFGAPKGTPPEIIAVLNKQCNDAVRDPTIAKRVADLGAVVAPPNTPQEFAAFIAGNIEKWRKVVKFANIKPI